MSRKVVYVSGPYTADQKWQKEMNVAQADKIGIELALKGVIPVVPHTMYDNWERHVDYDTILNGAIEIVKRCDAVYKYASSPGADLEELAAEEVGIPVFTRMDTLKEWISNERAKERNV